MSEIGISTPVVKWQGETLPVLPNSVSYKLGGGERSVRAFSTGGNSAITVHTTNAETLRSELKFGLPNTVKAMDIVARMQQALGGIDIELTDGDLQVAFVGLSLTNDPEIKLSHDGSIDLEFMGDPVQVGGNI